jgi:uncharacterized membrane protein YtjA (UPF0391 family)
MQTNDSAPQPTSGADMLHYTIVFFVLALVAALLGFGGIASSAAAIAKLFFVGFIILAVVSLIFGGRRRAL